MEPIILASESPRRKEFLTLMGLPFTSIAPDIDESIPPGSEPRSIVKELAIRKVEKITASPKDTPPLWVCGADTLISLNSKIFGKPINRSEANSMLKALQGQTHEVLTAVALYSGRTKTIDCRLSASEVTFAKMDEKEIEWYLNTDEWKGAAGAYKIQGKASCFIKKINGSYSGIAGLPLNDFYNILIDNGYPFGVT